MSGYRVYHPKAWDASDGVNMTNDFATFNIVLKGLKLAELGDLPTASTAWNLFRNQPKSGQSKTCLLYTSDAADDLLQV